MISHRFQVYGLPGDYDECEPLAIEIRCTHCGACEEFGRDQMTTPLMELIEWATEHKATKGHAMKLAFFRLVCLVIIIGVIIVVPICMAAAAS